MAKKPAKKKRPAPERRAAAPKARPKRKTAKAKSARTGRKGGAAARKPAKTAARRKAATKAAGARSARSAAPKARAAKRAAVKRPKKAVRPMARAKAQTARVPAKVTKKTAAAAAPRKAPAQAPAKKAAPVTARTPSASRPARAKKIPALQRERRSVEDTAPVRSAPSSLVPNQHASSASSGSHELRDRLAAHTGTGPEITAGDVDANWESAESVGDEAPGGDNPTPGQDVVDEIGRALGVEYDDDEELQGGDEIAARDHHRWELDPASSDDFDER